MKPHLFPTLNFGHQFTKTQIRILYSALLFHQIFLNNPHLLYRGLLLWNHYLGNSEKEIKSFMLLQNKMKPSILKSSSIHFEKSNIHLIFGKKTSAVFSNYSP